MRCFLPHLLLVLIAAVAPNKGECEKGCSTPTLIYDDLKCTPKYESPSDCCPKEYDCSHIYNRPAETCHVKGKILKVGEEPDFEDVRSLCKPSCRCTEGSEFSCPELLDGCAEDWVGGYPQPNCYLKYALNGCCADGEVCPPFEGNINCEVKGVTYKEGLLFDHPTQKCTKCVCKKGFEGKFVSPFCEKFNCVEEMKSPKEINSFCAPFYKDSNSCCPDSWICPSANDLYISSIKTPSNPDLHCKFGEEVMNIGDKLDRIDKDLGDIYCECRIPPYLSCKTKSARF